MRIIINIPEDFRDDEIIININRDGTLPFTDEPEQKTLEEELTPKEIDDLNSMMNYYIENMYGDVEVEEAPVDLDFGGDIEVG